MSRTDEVCFVQLICDGDVREERVTSAERARRKKIASVDLLRAVHDEHDLHTPVPNRTSLTIDTTSLAAQDAARKIADHYGLKLL